MTDFHVAVKQGPQPDRESSALAEVRCNGCRGWYLKRLGVCPDCGLPRPAFNKWLRHAQLDAHTHAMVANAER